MEENLLVTRKKNQTIAAHKTKSDFFRSFFRTQLHRFSKNCLLSSFPADQKRLFVNLSLECWSKPPDKRTQKDYDDIVSILEQEGIFFEIKNNKLVLKHFAKTIKVQHFQTNQIIYEPTRSNEKIMKIIRGTAVVKSTMDSLTGLERVRGNYIEEPQNLNSTKKNFVVATSLLSVFSIDKQTFEEGINAYLTQKAILRMFQKTPLFSKFTLKQIENICQYAKQKTYYNKQTFFKHRQLEVTQMFYIVQGEVALYLHDNHQLIKICTISDGSLFGEQNLFLIEQGRPYTAIAQSYQVKILCIQYQDCKDCIKRYNKSFEYCMKDSNYQQLIQQRLGNYDSAIKKNTQIRQLFHSKSVHHQNYSPKTVKLGQMVKIGHSIHERIQSLAKFAKKRNLIQDNIKSDYINFSVPLFHRSDFPQLKGSLQRFANEQKRAKQLLELPKINKLR